MNVNYLNAAANNRSRLFTLLKFTAASLPALCLHRFIYCLGAFGLFAIFFCPAVLSEPNKTTVFAARTSEAEVVAEIDEPIGNMTFTPDNRKIFSIHPFYKRPIRVAELISKNSFKPFPNLDWNTPKSDSDLYFDDVLGLRSDESGVVWILDMGNRSLKIADLLDRSLDEKTLAARVERYSDKENNGGISLDNAGNVYSTEPERGAVGIVCAGSRTHEKYTSNATLGWPDRLSYSPDGYMYVSDWQIDKSPLCNSGKALNKPPYLLYRFKPVTAGRCGH